MKILETKKLIITIWIIAISLPIVFANDNENYINQELSKLDKFLLKCDFVTGEIYLDNDTITTDILLFKRKDKINNYLFCITRSANDSILIYTAKDILGYRIVNDCYVKRNSNNGDYFIHKIKSGAIDLYDRARIPSDNRFLYFLTKSNSQNYYIINPYEANIKEYKMPNPSSGNSRATISYLEDQGVEKKFKEFISIYMYDCVRVKNMVKSDFYTISSIPSIVESYNNCFDSY